MSSSAQRSAKLSKFSNQTTPQSKQLSSSSSTLSSHLAMIEMKQRILNSLSKLADRDTHQIALEDLQQIIQTLNSDGVSMFLNCLYESSSNDAKPNVKKESLRLLAAAAAVHTVPAAAHLTKIIAHIVKRIKDSDSQVRDACRDAIGALAALYLKDGGGNDGVVGLFVKPLFEVMSENNKGAQSGAALCLAKVVESANGPMVQKVCPRVCKYLQSGCFWGKASLLQVVASLSRVGAIAPQSMEPLLQSVHDCLGSSDWATRKAAADALSALSSNPNVSAEVAASTVNVLESCRFDKIKPARESMNEALQLWKKIAGKDDQSSNEHKVTSNDGNASESAEHSDKKDIPNLSPKNSSNGVSPTDPSAEGKGNNFYDKAVGILKKKVPALTDKEPNPEFFQKLERRASVEVVVPRRCANSSDLHNVEGSESTEADQRVNPDRNGHSNDPFKPKNGSIQREAIGDLGDSTHRDEFSRNCIETEGSMNNKGNWLAIQGQLMQLERQQTYLMNMLRDFMGGSHDSMVTLENRVRGLERIVEDLARDFSVSSSVKRGTGSMAGLNGSSNRPSNKYNGFPEYSSGRLGKGNFEERFATFDGIAKSQSPFLRSDAPSDSWDFNAHGKNGQKGSRRSGKSENELDQVGLRRGWETGSGPVRFGEGPSARSVWQASKDEATLEAIRVAGEDNGSARRAAAVPEMTAEALDDDGTVQDRDPVWNSWNNAMDALHVDDLDTAFAEILSTEDNILLAKLMDRTGPVLDQLSQEVAGRVVNAVSSTLLVDQNFFEMCLYWFQQLTDIVMENGVDAIKMPVEVKYEVLLDLYEASSSFNIPEEWEGSSPLQILFQLGSAWEIDVRHLCGTDD